MSAHREAREWLGGRGGIHSPYDKMLSEFAADVLRGLADAGKSGTLDTREWLRAEAERLERGE